jgi:hypothetical protein
VTNKRKRKRTLVAFIKYNKNQDIIDALNKPLDKRKLVEEITLDIGNSMQLVTGTCFPEGSLVADLFHVVKLVLGCIAASN